MRHEIRHRLPARTSGASARETGRTNASEDNENGYEDEQVEAAGVSIPPRRLRVGVDS